MHVLVCICSNVRQFFASKTLTQDTKVCLCTYSLPWPVLSTQCVSMMQYRLGAQKALLTCPKTLLALALLGQVDWWVVGVYLCGVKGKERR